MIAERVFGLPTRRRFLRWERAMPVVRRSGTLIVWTKEWVAIPKYSSVYAQACEVVRQMRVLGWSVELNEAHGECVMTKADGQTNYHVATSSHYVTDAICAAALGACAIAMEG